MIQETQIYRDNPDEHWYDAFVRLETFGVSDEDDRFSLNASRIAIQGADVYDEVHRLAFGDSCEELLVWAGIRGISLKSSCQGAEA